MIEVVEAENTIEDDLFVRSAARKLTVEYFDFFAIARARRRRRGARRRHPRALTGIHLRAHTMSARGVSRAAATPVLKVRANATYCAKWTNGSHYFDPRRRRSSRRSAAA
jgi:hypothetical protein